MSVAAPILRVLLAEDAKDFRDLVCDELRHRGFAVMPVEDGTLALQAFRNQVFDVVLTDLAMPGYNGLQVAKACKGQRTHVKVVLLTAWDLLLDDEDCMDHGVDLVIPKPVQMRALAAALHQVAYNPAPFQRSPRGTR